MNLSVKRKLAQKRRWRIRNKISGTSQRPRLSVRFSNQHIHVQAIDDRAGKTLVSVSTNNKELRERSLKPNVTGAAELGKLVAERAKQVGIETIVFDRGERRYHGTVKAFAEAAREGGLRF
ncbi:MAG: 50S ribosomal protein L18 [Opitutales bacterium]